MVQSLAEIFQKYLHEMHAAYGLEGSKSQPLFKEREKDVPGNYRPVSLTSEVCKVLEFIERDGVMGHRTASNLQSFRQHDFAKTFDFVPPERLLNKAKALRIECDPFRCITKQ